MAYDELVSNACVASSRVYMSQQTESDEHFIDDILTGAQARITLWRSDDCVCVAFRGSSELDDWAHNACAFQRPLPAPHGLHVRAHAGFLRQYSAVHGRILEILKRVSARRLVLTGHSLGGALATIAAALLPREYSFDLVTFGCPRAGNGPFAKLVEDRCDSVSRVVHDRDVVPVMPMRAMNYAHVTGPWLLLHPDGSVEKRRRERSFVSEMWLRLRGAMAADFGISDHFMSAYMAGVAHVQPEAEAAIESAFTANTDPTGGNADDDAGAEPEVLPVAESTAVFGDGLQQGSETGQDLETEQEAESEVDAQQELKPEAQTLQEPEQEPEPEPEPETPA